MKRRIGIIGEYFLAFVVIILLLLAIAGVVVVKFHGDELKAYVMEQVNERLDTKVHVEKVSVKVFHKFPSTSIVLHDITVWSSHNFNIHDFEGTGSDTLLTAETVSVSFNLFGMIRKKFEIRQVEVSNGSVRLFIDSGGEGNYRLLVKPDQKKESRKLVDVTHFRLSNFSFQLDNHAKDLKASGWLDQLELNGKLSKRNAQIKGSMRGTVGEISNKGILYASDRNIGARLNLDVQDSVYTIRTGNLQIDRILADVDGSFHVFRGSGIELNLVAAARDLEIHEVLDLLPREQSKPFLGIRGNGILQVYARVTGMASSTLTPLIEADFQTSDAALSWERIPFSLKNLNLTGTYSNGGAFNPETTILTMESISAVIGKDHISGRCRIHNFIDPDFSFQLKGDIHPEQWIEWYESIPLAEAAGTVITDIKVSGSYDRLKSPGKKFIAFDISGGISLEDVMVRITDEGLPFRDLNGSVHIDNDFWEPTFSGSFGSSDFTIAGTGLNLLSFLLEGRDNLVVSATFRSNHLDLREVLDQLPRNSNGRNAMVVFPENLNLRLDFLIRDFAKDLLLAENVRGLVQYDSPFLYVDSLTMQTMEGTLHGSFGMTQNSNGTIFSSVNTSLYNLDITELFEAFNNFGQQQLTYEHLKGTISGTSVFSAEFNPAFTIVPQSILCEADISILDGELNSFSPIMALSRFVEMDELRNIRFKKLENNILIKDSQVIIPIMDIQSNALNLSASGTHDFNNLFDYRLKLKVSELLYSKARGSRISEFEVAEDEADTRTLFLKVYDNGSGTTVEVDREKTARKIRDDLKNEKTELKQILNEELGLFKHDGEVIQQEALKDEQDKIFRFNFTDEPDSSSVPDMNREKGSWRKKRIKTDTLQNKPASGFVIDE